MELSRAVEAFARGFANAKSVASPYTATRHGPLWVLRDEPGFRRISRLTEVVATALPAREAVALIEGFGPCRHALCAIAEMDADHEAARRDHMSSGYRLTSRQPLFVIKPARTGRTVQGIERVSSLELAKCVAVAARSRQIRPEDLESPNPVRRLYAAIEQGEVAGWVSSVRATDEANWVANLFVAPRFRGKGLGKLLMTALLEDDAAHGVRWSVLLASTAGARLYPKVGYEQIGLLQLFVPVRREGIQLRPTPCCSKAN